MLINSEQSVQAQLACWGTGWTVEDINTSCLHACLSLQRFFALRNTNTSYSTSNTRRQTSGSFKGNTAQPARCRHCARQPDFATRAGGSYLNKSYQITYHRCLLRVGGQKDLQSETDD